MPAHTHAGFNSDGTTKWKAEPLDSAIDPDLYLGGGGGGDHDPLKDPTPQLPGFPKNYPPFMHFQPKVPIVHGSGGSSSSSSSAGDASNVKTSPEDAASLGPNSDGWVGGWGASGNQMVGDSGVSTESTEKEQEPEQQAQEHEVRRLATMTEEEARAFHQQHKLAHEMQDVHEMEHVNNQATRLLTDLQLMGTTLFVAVLMVIYECSAFKFYAILRRLPFASYPKILKPTRHVWS